MTTYIVCYKVLLMIATLDNLKPITKFDKLLEMLHRRTGRNGTGYIPGLSGKEEQLALLIIKGGEEK